MRFLPPGWSGRTFTWLSALLLTLAAFAPLTAQQNDNPEPVQWTDDEAAWILARQYLEGGDGAHAAVTEALRRMGWSVRTHQGAVVSAPPAGADTGLAIRDYELEELLWNPSAQPTMRLISMAQAIAVPFQGADPEELAQDIVTTLRLSARSTQPQQRFWARFIIALGRSGPASYDMLSPGASDIIPPEADRASLAAAAKTGNPFAMMAAMQGKPAWHSDDPVLAPSPRPERDGDEDDDDEDSMRSTTPKLDEKRMQELQQQYSLLIPGIASPDEATRAAAEAKMALISQEMSWISGRQQNAIMRLAAESSRRAQAAMNDDDEEEEDEDDEDSDRAERFLAEWREQPLSLLQVALITRVLAADLRLRPGSANAPRQAASRPRHRGTFPLAMLTLAQATGGPTFSGQFEGAIGDIWATTTGAYTGEMLNRHLPDSSYAGRVAIANTIIAWFKTIMTVARQKITIEVENLPLVRTKTRSPGEQRRARANVHIDFPKSDVLKAIRAAGNLAAIDLQMPDGGAISGAKVIWRLPEGSYNGKYQSSQGGSQYRPDLAVVQFAQAGGKEAYVSFTDSNGDAFITIEGVPQRRNLPPTVRPYPRRAAVGVEVTLKVGNLTQDLNDAINTAMGGPVLGGLSFIADMILRTSFFFQQNEVFPVRDWREPTWQGEFEITVKAAGSKQEDGFKGGPPTQYRWQMDRYMEGRLQTPESEEETEKEKGYKTDGRHQLEIDGDSRYFRLSDQSSARSTKIHNRYDAKGPLQIQPPGQNRLATYSRSEPSGSATLTFTGGKMILELRPFFGAECLVSRSEQSGGRSSNKAGPAYLSLLDGVYPETFTLIADNDGSDDFVEGSQTFECMGTLPFVPNFDATVTVKYRLWKNDPPPENARR